MNWLLKILGWTARDESAAKGPPVAPIVTLDAQRTWTESDRAAWRGVMASPLGVKLVAVTKAAHYRMLRAASEDHFHAAQSVHCARGFEEAIKWLQLLSVSADVPAQTQNTSRAHGEAQPGERDAEAELLSRMSPR